MWDFLSKVSIHIIDKVSFVAMFIFLSIFGLLWFCLPFEIVAYHLSPRELPEGIYWLFLFVSASAIFLVGKSVDNFCYPRFKRWRAFRAWEKCYLTLSQEEIETVRHLVIQDYAPLKLTPKQAEKLASLNMIQVKFFHPSYNSYILTPSFRAFILHKFQSEIIKQSKGA